MAKTVRATIGSFALFHGVFKGQKPRNTLFQTKATFYKQGHA